MVQKEVANRLVDKKQTLLSLGLSFYAHVNIVEIVKKYNFYPSPKVDSALIYIHNIQYEC